MCIRDSVKYFKNGSSYTVKVIKQDGTVAGAGEKVTDVYKRQVLRVVTTPVRIWILT